jgi:prepilin-type N-terminal cleavage/methylation domain-containing protein/prepilin-type processing-associated H-X9-DG protein
MIPRRGFSLVELLVVIGIILLITGIVFPAIQRIRESANAMTCASNLRQIGLAAHHYQSDHARLPPGYLGPSLSRNTDHPAHLYEGQWIGHLPLLLSYLEQDALFKQIKVDFGIKTVTREPWFWKPGPVPYQENYTAGMTKVKIFRCPSAPNYNPEVGNPLGGGTLLGVHVFNSPSIGVFTDWWKDDYVRAAQFRFLAKTNYVGVAGCGSGTHPFFGQYEGIYTNRSELSLGSVSARDGTSNTLLYGETCGTRLMGGPDTADICWMAGGGLGTYAGLHRSREAAVTNFSSYHATGVQFCFADGSVRKVRFGNTQWDFSSSFTADWHLLQQLAGWRDGGTGDVSDLVD